MGRNLLRCLTTLLVRPWDRSVDTSWVMACIGLFRIVLLNYI